MHFKLILFCCLIMSCFSTTKAQIATARIDPIGAGVLEAKITLVLEDGTMESTPLSKLDFENQTGMQSSISQIMDENQKIVTQFLNKMESRGYHIISNSSDGSYYIFRKKE